MQDPRLPGILTGSDLWIPFTGLELVVTFREHSKRMWKTSEAEEHFSVPLFLVLKGFPMTAKVDAGSQSCPTLMGGGAQHPTLLLSTVCSVASFLAVM